MDKGEFNVSIAITIRLARIENNMTQSEVSHIMGIDTQNFSKYERGLISPTVFWLLKYCDAIGYDPIIFMKKLLKNREEGKLT